MRPPNKPVIITRLTGDESVEEAYQMLLDGTDTLEANHHVCLGRENDPNDHSMGHGGLPNEEGTVELDASCMHGPTRRAGSVGGVRNIRNVCLVSRRIMWTIPGNPGPEWTNEIHLRTKKLLSMAADFGIQPEERLRAVEQVLWPTTGTIHVSAVNTKGEMSGATTTSGFAWKLPGRLGDSPIIGAGCYTDQDVGSAGREVRSAAGRNEPRVATVVAIDSKQVCRALRVRGREQP
jgi:N4-(beta-N-acetylglucosaminyl)-L-asparaginase